MPTGSLKVLWTVMGIFTSRDVVTTNGSSSEKTDMVAFPLGREGRVTTTKVTKSSGGRQRLVWLPSPKTGDVFLNLTVARTGAVGERCDPKRPRGYNADKGQSKEKDTASVCIKCYKVMSRRRQM